MEPDKPKLSRLQFLKFLGISTATVLTISEKSVPVYAQEANIFSENVANSVKEAEARYGIQIVSPSFFGLNNEPNRLWLDDWIKIVLETLPKLPPEYLTSPRSPKKILLLCAQGSTSEGAGGGYANRELALFLSETFNPNSGFSGDASRLFSSQGKQLESTIVHEYTHSFTEAFPDVLQEWIQKMGWAQDNNNWINSNPSSLIPEAEADKSPIEDIAVSAQLMYANPTILSSERRQFFLENPHYKNWSSVTEFIREHSLNSHY